MSAPAPASTESSNLEAIFSNIPLDTTHCPVRAPSPGVGLLKNLRLHSGLTLLALGKRVGMTKQRVLQIENAEVKNSGFVSTYQRLAEAMDYDAVLVLVPRQGSSSIDDAQTAVQP